jgi:L-seryl-tRNA(Ser) seleniumtransferase
MSSSSPSPLRNLPSVDRLLRDPLLQALLTEESYEVVLAAAREELQVTRTALQNGGGFTAHDLPRRVADRVQSVVRSPLQPVINATGVIVHTNLGRAPLSEAALAAIDATARGYTNLEYDLVAGERGSRHALVTDLLRRLTGAQDALVVNNNAAALLLILSALAQGRQAIISRGQLVEIGGGFRIPDVMLQSGVSLVEIGTTNRTYPQDYEAAISDQTALILRVHTSNFQVVGFTHTPTLSELVAVAREHDLPVVDDLGSGALMDTAAYGLAHEPQVQESLAAGAALVAFSGDKLLGGPQAGIILGEAALIARLRHHPLTRAVRPDKLTLAALAATLVHYLRGEAAECVPVWQMIAAPLAQIDERATRLAAGLPVPSHIEETRAAVGGGSLPGATLPSRALALDVSTPEHLAASLRRGDTPVVGRIEGGTLLLDLRTVLPSQDDDLARALSAALNG